MSNFPDDQLLQMETTCGSLLYALQIIWNEVGESDTERDKMLLEIEEECLQVYRKKVDQANKTRAQLRQAIADSEAEIAAICSAMGELPMHRKESNQNTGSLKDQLKAIVPQLEEMHKRKCDRLNQFTDVSKQKVDILKEISRNGEYMPTEAIVDESNLSIRKLEELHRQLQALQKEKHDRLKQVSDHINTIKSLCSVLGMDFKHAVTEIHPSLDGSTESKNISNDTVERLVIAIERLREVKVQRMRKRQDLATTMLELWNLMDTPAEEQQMFQNVTCNIAASEEEITEPNSLAVDFINYVETEVLRLEGLKGSKMKELVLKKRSELEEICRRTHMIVEIDTTMDQAIDAMESGAIDLSSVLEQIETQITKVKEEAYSRKEILEKVEKWLASCDEESWLEEYNRDENRYNAGRGAHLTLKRAEKARATVAKLPAIVEALTSKTAAWEKERGIEFTYDGLGLLSMLEEYSLLRQEKEQERQRQKDQKRLQGQLIAEQEVLFGSKPSPLKLPSAKKVPKTSMGGAAANRRLTTHGGATLHPTKLGFHSTKLNHGGRDSEMKKHPSKATSAQEIEAPVIRKPFSPVTTNFLDLNNLHKEASITPSKQTYVRDEENRTPKSMRIPVPTTPSTVSLPMQTSTTPAFDSVLFGSAGTKEVEEENEYSFEERRAGFVVPKSHVKSLLV